MEHGDAGQYADDESGLFYNYYRFYDPTTGRYLRSDPIGLNGGLNTYGYVGGSPLLGVDPMGLVADSLTTSCGYGTLSAEVCTEIAVGAKAPVSIAEALGIAGIASSVGTFADMCIDAIFNKDEVEETRCKKVKNECIAKCSETHLPTKDYGFTFQNCVNKCQENQGCL